MMIVGWKDDAAAAQCVVTPQLTAGPYFIDEHLNRSEIAAGQPGLPLNLNIEVLDSKTCSPLKDVQIDVWHANAAGIYSDIAGLGSGGEKFLRGYQVTDQNGRVKFRTIYPGWYMGRTTHIHVMARRFNASHDQTLEASTQFFFDDTLTDTVYRTTPYNKREERHTRNADDGLFGNRSTLLLPLKGSLTSGYDAKVSIGIST